MIGKSLKEWMEIDYGVCIWINFLILILIFIYIFGLKMIVVFVFLVVRVCVFLNKSEFYKIDCVLI